MAKSWNKWNKYLTMVKHGSVRRFLPETRWLTEVNVWNMLKRYGHIVIKPIGSYGGNGVFMVKSLGNDKYRFQSGAKVSIVTGKANAYARIRKLTGKSSIIQRKIQLGRVQGRPYDLRVMVQRSRGSSSWSITGKLAKVAGKGYIITNTNRSGGYVTSVDRVFSSALSSSGRSRARAQLSKAAHAAAHSLVKRFPHQRVMGIDMGVEPSGKVWIIEANFRPSLSLFSKLKDKSMLRKIKSYGYRSK
jgi:hypothetical protein